MRIDEIMQYVRLEMPGAPDFIITQNIAAVANDFCNRTRVWNEIQQPIAMRDGVSQYDIEPPVGARAIGVSEVWQGDRQLVGVTQSTLSSVLPEWQTARAPAPLYFNVANDHRLITVYPRPDLAMRAKLTLRVILTPKRTAQELPDFLIDEHLDALVCGTKARMFAQVNVPWSNQMTAPSLTNTYDQAVTDARIKELHGNVTSSLRVTPRRFG